MAKLIQIRVNPAVDGVAIERRDINVGCMRSAKDRKFADLQRKILGDPNPLLLFKSSQVVDIGNADTF